MASLAQSKSRLLREDSVVGEYSDDNESADGEMVDSGAVEHFFDHTTILRSRYKLFSHQELTVPRMITTAGRHQVEGVGQRLLCGHIVDGEGIQRLL